MTKTYETVMLSKLVPYANNPRKNDDAVPAVEASIEQVGYITPIVVDENYEVLAGHTRLKALNAMGTKEAEVLIVDGLTDEEKRKYRILDNKTGDLAEWDVDLLELELEIPKLYKSAGKQGGRMIDVIIQRWENLTGEKAVLLND